MTGSRRRRRARWATVAALTALVLAPPAAAQNDVDTPHGYRFCGWKDLVHGGWTYEEPEPGAFVRLFARKMRCRTARRKYRRVRYEQTPPYRPRLKRYRCVKLDGGYEYADFRCAKKRRPRVALRWQTGA